MDSPLAVLWQSMDSTWTVHGILWESLDSPVGVLWQSGGSPLGVPKDPWVSVTCSLVPNLYNLYIAQCPTIHLPQRQYLS